MYDLEVEESYTFTPDTYDRLRVAAVHWLDVLYVLRTSRPVLRRHIGAVLHVVARDRSERWLAVALLEQSDDTYTVEGARYLDDDEATAVEKLMRREQ